MKTLLITISFLLTLVVNANAFIGNNSNGTTSDPINNYINVSRFQASSNMTISTLNARVVGISGRYKFAIYAGNSSGPSQLMQQSSEISNPSSGWYSLPLATNVSLTNGQYYWFASWSDTQGAAIYCNTSGGSTRWESSPRTYGQWPTTLTMQSGNVDFNYCIYANAITNLPPSTNTYAKVTLAWDASPSSTNMFIQYKVYSGPSSRNYTNVVDAKAMLTITLSNIIVGIPTYYAATAYITNGLESVYSDELVYTPPAATRPGSVHRVRIPQ